MRKEKFARKPYLIFNNIMRIEKVSLRLSDSLFLLFDILLERKRLTPLPNEGTESACSPRPTRKRGPQLEPMLKQNLNFLRYEQNFLVFWNL